MAIRIFSGAAIPQGGGILPLPPSLEICMKRETARSSKPVKTEPDSHGERGLFRDDKEFYRTIKLVLIKARVRDSVTRGNRERA